jgi:hypothetical protein
MICMGFMLSSVIKKAKTMFIVAAILLMLIGASPAWKSWHPKQYVLSMSI